MLVMHRVFYFNRPYLLSMQTDILKLFFYHDQRLDQLADRNANRTKEEIQSTLADFMRPDPTYSRLYFTGTDLKGEKFGLNILKEYESLIDALNSGLDSKVYQTASKSFSSLKDSVNATELGEVILISDQTSDFPIETLHIDVHSNVGHLKSELKEALELGYVVVYKEQAKDGFDLHLFSKKNIYTQLFYPLQRLVPGSFRFFSINGRKFSSERHFYFETWTLDRPPHGFEEVHPESVL